MNKITSRIAFFVAGVGVGAIIAALYTPKSGKETRRMIAQKAGEGMEAEGIEHHQRAAEGVAGEGRAVGAEFPAQMLLQHGAQILQERRGDGDRDPERGHAGSG